MIKLDDILDRIKILVKKNYPIKLKYKTNIPLTLSHFDLNFVDKTRILSINFDINGNLKKNNKKIKYVILKDKKMTWNKYLKIIISLIPKNICNENLVLNYLHSFNLIDDLNIKSIELEDQKIINVDYIKPKIKKTLLKKYPDNHFVFNSFSVSQNKKEIKKEIDRLIKNRDNYSEIHFHVENNGGGDIVPAHLILRCLVGKKEDWMKNIKKITKDKQIFEWDCWKEEIGNNSEVVKDINLKKLPDYKTKYHGKIHIHMSKKSGSATWYFITYLIYAFGGKVKRYSKVCFGRNIKFGSVKKDSQLILHGMSDRDSGDGNSFKDKIESISISVPTEQFISSSIKKTDINRYWTE